MAYPTSATRIKPDKSHQMQPPMSHMVGNITPSDTLFLSPPIRSLYVGVGGDVSLVLADQPDKDTAIVVALGAGWHPLVCEKILNTGTDATGLVGGT